MVKATMMYVANIELQPNGADMMEVEATVCRVVGDIADLCNRGITIEDPTWLHWIFAEERNNVCSLYSKNPEVLVAAAKEAFEAIAEAIGVFDNSP